MTGGKISSFLEMIDGEQGPISNGAEQSACTTANWILKVLGRALPKVRTREK